MGAWVVFLLGLVIGFYAGWAAFAVAIGPPPESAVQEGENFLSEPVELERRSISRWSGLKVLP